MRYLVALVFLCFSVTCAFNASAKKLKRKGGARTEVELMNSIVNCMRHKDTIGYYYLFPPFDTLWRRVTHNSDHTPEAEKQLAHLKEHPQALIDFDPFYNRHIMSQYLNVLSKGEDSGLHWNGIAIQRYELKNEPLTKDLAGYEKIAPERFMGYLFVKDMVGRMTFCITITEIQKIEGFYFGGQVVNILEASSIDEYHAKEGKEREYFAWRATHHIADTPKVDSARNAVMDSIIAAAEDDDVSKIRKEVVDRKYYEGKFDNEIPVKLYVRYMKDIHNSKVFYYDGLYKFGDQKSYVRLDITITDGKWTMEDDPPVGTLELVLKDRIYTGSWLNNDNGTGYDVYMKQADLPQRKMEELERILEKGLSGSASQESIEKTPEELKKDKKRNKARGGDDN